MFYNLLGKRRFSLRLPNPTRGRVTSAATAAARAYCEIPGDNRVKCGPVVAYRGAIESRQSGWRGRQTGSCLSPVNNNSCRVTQARLRRTSVAYSLFKPRTQMTTDGHVVPNSTQRSDDRSC